MEAHHRAVSSLVATRGFSHTPHSPLTHPSLSLHTPLTHPTLSPRSTLTLPSDTPHSPLIPPSHTIRVCQAR
jgi:hypothetical protein